MSRTVRRKHLNRKVHILNYYFTIFTPSEIKRASTGEYAWLSEWEFHSDNFQLLSKRKQLHAKLSYKRKRADFKQQLRLLDENNDIVHYNEKLHDIIWEI